MKTFLSNKKYNKKHLHAANITTNCVNKTNVLKTALIAINFIRSTVRSKAHLQYKSLDTTPPVIYIIIELCAVKVNN